MYCYVHKCYFAPSLLVDLKISLSRGSDSESWLSRWGDTGLSPRRILHKCLEVTWRTEPVLWTWVSEVRAGIFMHNRLLGDLKHPPKKLASILLNSMNADIFTDAPETKDRRSFRIYVLSHPLELGTDHREGKRGNISHKLLFRYMTKEHWPPSSYSDFLFFFHAADHFWLCIRNYSPHGSFGIPWQWPWEIHVEVNWLANEFNNVFILPDFQNWGEPKGKGGVGTGRGKAVSLKVHFWLVEGPFPQGWEQVRISLSLQERNEGWDLENALLYSAKLTHTCARLVEIDLPK